MSTLRRLLPSRPQQTRCDEVDAARSVLLIDDEQAALDALRRVIYLARRSWKVVAACSGEEGLAKIRQQYFHAVVCDMSMPGLHGLGVLKSVQREFPDVTRIALTGFADEEWKVKHATVAQVFLLKPCSPSDLVDAVEHPERFNWTAAAPRPIISFEQANRELSKGQQRFRNWDDDQPVKFS